MDEHNHRITERLFFSAKKTKTLTTYPHNSSMGMACDHKYIKNKTKTTANWIKLDKVKSCTCKNKTKTSSWHNKPGLILIGFS